MAELPELTWTDARAIGVEGRMWTDTVGPFDRLPERVRPHVRERLWDWARESTGMALRFESDATDVWARWRLGRPAEPVPIENRLSHSGLDLYATDDGGRLRWAGYAPPNQWPESTARLTSRASLDPATRRFQLYLPSHNVLESLEIGVPAGSRLTPLPVRPRPMVFYGTSIVHGGTASRPGMIHPAILGRRLDRHVVNLGFSGEGRMDAPLVELLAEIDGSVYVVDCLPNMGEAEVAERTEPLVRRLRAARPDVPIVLVEDRTIPVATFNETLRRQHADRRAAQRSAFQRLCGAGVKGLYYVKGEGLFGDDGDATLDGSHPSDLGYWRMAEALEPVLRAALGG